MALILPPRVSEILSHEAGARAKDIDAVHDMRVATKRLREAARVFRPAFGTSRMARHLAHLEALNDALGRARELDVMGEHLQALSQRDPGLQTGLQPLLDSIAQQRIAADEQLAPILDETVQFLRSDFEELLCDRTRKRADVWKMPFCELAQQVIVRRVDQILDLEEAVRDPAAVAEFHRMRIAVKKARYALELCKGFCRRKARKALALLSALQEIMGQAHDCDVLAAMLSEAKGSRITDEAADRASTMLAEDRALLYRHTLALLDEVHARRIPRTLRKGLG